MSPQQRETIAIVGAGVVGMACALQLQRTAGNVVAFDPLQPGGGASYGNSGLIAVDSCGPMSMPGMLRQVPRWLTDPDGPLAVDLRYAFRALPWLLGRLRSGRLDSIVAASDAFRALHKPSVDIYRDLLGAAHFSDLIRIDGHIEAWEGDEISAGERLGAELRRRHGIEFEELGMAELRRLIPAISGDIKRAHFVRNGAHAVNPLRLVQTLADLFSEAGGTMMREQVMKLLPIEGGGYRVLTNVGDYVVGKLVVAGGAWSRPLLKSLGVRLPLEAERGYHVMVANAPISLAIPVLHRSRGFAAVPMENGIRFAGTVEIAGLTAEPNERRVATLKRHAQRLFPSLKTDDATMWMGLRPCFPDNLPVIDRVAHRPGLFVACGHGHFGVTSAPATGMAIASLVAGSKPSLDLAPFALARFG